MSWAFHDIYNSEQWVHWTLSAPLNLYWFQCKKAVAAVFIPHLTFCHRNNSTLEMWFIQRIDENMKENLHLDVHWTLFKANLVHSMIFGFISFEQSIDDLLYVFMNSSHLLRLVFNSLFSLSCYSVCFVYNLTVLSVKSMVF